MRRFVIGDIHGCAKALRTIIEAIEPNSDDELIFVGDYIDRGPNSRDVINQVIALEDACRTVTLRGNHEIMMQGVALHGFDDQVWLANGGRATLSSYGGKLSKIPDAHLEFFKRLRRFHENSDSIFVHAGYDPTCDMRMQTDMSIYWMHLNDPFPAPHKSGKRVFVGHTPQSGGHILDAGHLVGVDTYCFGGGYLTAYETTTSEIIQADKHGHLRKDPLAMVADRARRAAGAIGRACRKLSPRKQAQAVEPAKEAPE